MYIETSSPRRQGDNAKLQMSVSGNGAAACLVFYYHMYGGTIGTLNVYSGNELVFSVSVQRRFFVLEYRKRHFPGLYCLKNKVRKMAIFGPKPLVNPFGKMSIFRLY